MSITVSIEYVYNGDNSGDRWIKDSTIELSSPIQYGSKYEFFSYNDVF